jgi:hypothetical protein
VPLRRISLTATLGVCATASPDTAAGIDMHAMRNRVIERLLGGRETIFEKKI